MDAEAAPWKAAHFAKERRGKITSPETREAGLGPTSNEKNSPESRVQRPERQDEVQCPKGEATSNVQRSTFNEKGSRAPVHMCTSAQVHSILNPQFSIPNSQFLCTPAFPPLLFPGTNHQSPITLFLFGSWLFFHPAEEDTGFHGMPEVIKKGPE